MLINNGSEFKARFTKIGIDGGAVRRLAYPKCPRMNAHTERFNRTIQEKFTGLPKELRLEDMRPSDSVQLVDMLLEQW